MRSSLSSRVLVFPLVDVRAVPNASTAMVSLIPSHNVYIV